MNVLMFAHGGSLNRGCEAIVRSTAALLKQRMNGVKVYLTSSMPDTDRGISALDGIYDGTDNPIRKYSFDWFMTSFRYKVMKDDSYAYGKIHRKIIERIPSMDVCLSIGGDNYCYGEQPGWYEVDRIIKSQGKRLVLWGCSIGEEDLSESKLEDLRRFDLILARESLTYETLRGKGLGKVRLCADPAFTMDKEELPLPDGWKENGTVGLNFSPLVWKRNKASHGAVRSLIGHILASTEFTIALTPHVIQTGNDDYEMLRQFYEDYKGSGRVILLPGDLNAVQYKGYIGRMRFFIGARTHATIAAYSRCVPTMVLGYSVKSKGIAKDLFGEEKLVLDIRDISDSRKLTTKFDEMAREEAHIRQTLQAAVPRIQKRSVQAVDYLSELFA